MRDAGHRTPDAGHRTAKKAKIIYPPPRGVDIITDHVVAAEKVAEHHIGTKLCSCNTFEDISHLLIDNYKSYNYIR